MDVVDQAWRRVSSPSPAPHAREVFDGVLAAANRSQAKGSRLSRSRRTWIPRKHEPGPAQALLHYLVGERSPPGRRPPDRPPSRHGRPARRLPRPTRRPRWGAAAAGRFPTPRSAAGSRCLSGYGPTSLENRSVTRLGKPASATGRSRQ